MSAVEIIAELSKLTAEERSAIRQRLRELEEQDDLLFLDEAAVSMFQEIDRQEAHDAQHKGLL